jgi:hypothetical protein
MQAAEPSVLQVQQNQYGEERNQEATLYVGNIDERVTEALLWELFIQCGPVVNVHLPKDRLTTVHQGFGFVEFMSEEDADYTLKIMNNIKLFGKPIRVNKAAQNSEQIEADVGATLFIGNLDPMVDEKLLYDTFSSFGVFTVTPRIARDPNTMESKGYGFVSFDSFEASDAAIEAMNGQFLMNKAISVKYAMKKDGKERHGTNAGTFSLCRTFVGSFCYQTRCQGQHGTKRVCRFGTVRWDAICSYACYAYFVDAASCYGCTHDDAYASDATRYDTTGDAYASWYADAPRDACTSHVCFSTRISTTPASMETSINGYTNLKRFWSAMNAR